MSASSTTCALGGTLVRLSVPMSIEASAARRAQAPRRSRVHLNTCRDAVPPGGEVVAVGLEARNQSLIVAKTGEQAARKMFEVDFALKGVANELRVASGKVRDLLFHEPRRFERLARGNDDIFPRRSLHFAGVRAGGRLCAQRDGGRSLARATRI